MINFKNTLTLGAMFLTQLLLAQTPIGITVHDGGSIYFHGDTNNTVAAIDQNSKATVTRVLGAIEVGATDADTAKIGSTNKGEVWIEGSGLVRRKSGTADWKGDVVMNNTSNNQSILGGFESTNKFENLISNKNSGQYIDMNNNVEVENKFVYANSGYVRTDIASGTNGMNYAAKLRLNSTSSDAMNGSPSLGSKNYIIEGKLERNTANGNKYVFPMSIDLANSLGGAQIAEVTVGTGNGYVLGAFTKDTGVDNLLNIVDNNCTDKKVSSVINHGFWTLKNDQNSISNFNLNLKAHSIINQRTSDSFFTIVKKDQGQSNLTYTLTGQDPNNCQGFLSSSATTINNVSRINYSSFSDFAISPVEPNTCIPPMLSIGSPQCNGDDYEILINTNGSNLTSSIGNIVNSSTRTYVIAPKNTELEIIASNGSNCKTILKYKTPNLSCSTSDTCIPKVFAGNGICEGNNTWSFSFTKTQTDAIVNTSAGQVVGNSVKNIPIGTTVTLKVSNINSAACNTILIVNSPSNCNTTDNCKKPMVSISGYKCSEDQASYTLYYKKSSNVVIQNSHGTLNNDSIVNIGATSTFILKAYLPGCTDTMILRYKKGNCFAAVELQIDTLTLKINRFFDKNKNCIREPSEASASSSALPNDLLTNYYVKIFRLVNNRKVFTSSSKISDKVLSSIKLYNNPGEYSLLIDNNNSSNDTIANYPTCWTGKEIKFSISNNKLIDELGSPIDTINNFPKVCMQYFCDSLLVNIDNSKVVSGGTTNINIAANDIVTTGSKFKLNSNPKKGLVAIDSITGVAIYKSTDSSFKGLDSFTYSVTDPTTGIVKTTIVYITVGDPDNTDVIVNSEKDYFVKGNEIFDNKFNAYSKNYSIVTNSINGVISNFDSASGAFNYTSYNGKCDLDSVRVRLIQKYNLIGKTNDTFYYYVKINILCTQDDVPNYITPNGDGKNDKFVIPASYFVKYPNLKLVIYNRWGNIVWRSEGVYKNNWEGTHQINGAPLPDGVYYYIIEFEKDFNKLKTGFIQISRD